jgi:membrane dipeptidase
MIRLGMLIDLSHTSDATATQAIDIARAYNAPVMWSHSDARALNDISRNVPDEILKMIGNGKDENGVEKVDGVVMVNFAPMFLAPEGEGADVSSVADHVEHIANVTGKKQ